MKTVVKDNTWLTERVPDPENYGWGNGYVLIPKGHPLHGKDYDEINEFIDIHGGLTYSQEVTEEFLQFDELDTEDIGSWMVGFDTLHHGDNIENCSEEFVRCETQNLREQLENFNLTEG